MSKKQGMSKGQNNREWIFFSKIVRSRRSYKRRYSTANVDPEIIKDCIELARWAPSAHNAQPWRFLIFYKQDPFHTQLRSELIKSMTGKYRRDLIRDDVEPKKIDLIVKSSLEKFLEAPALLLIFLDMSNMDKYPDQPRMDAEFIMGTQSVAASIQILLLALDLRGIKCCWYCAPLFSADIIRDTLKIPENWHPQAFVTAGYPPKITEGSKTLMGPRPDKGLIKKENFNNVARCELEKILFDPRDFYC
ncbi:MAG: nitroreductase family protein [Promethearchaeota archaeon]